MPPPIAATTTKSRTGARGGENLRHGHRGRSDARKHSSGQKNRTRPLIHTTLEERGLLERIAVNVHPDQGLVQSPHHFTALFQDVALRTTPDFDRAYEEAHSFGRILAKRGRGSGFMLTLMQQRVCSSVTAGLNTAQTLLAGREVCEETEDGDHELAIQTDAEREALVSHIAALEGMDEDPKLAAMQFYLKDEGWLELGCIIFSQYYDTARWVADALAAEFPQETIGFYAGADRSRLYREGQAVGILREELKRLVADRQVRLMVATDAACEGLNLQTLGTLINVDLPWNPTRLEQRIGRIKRFGQARSAVDMLNLVHQGTVDEAVYARLSERMRNRYDLFGGLPDTICDDWIEDIEKLGEKMDQYIEERRQATGFDLRYNDSLQPSEDAWHLCDRAGTAGCGESDAEGMEWVIAWPVRGHLMNKTIHLDAVKCRMANRH